MIVDCEHNVKLKILDALALESAELASILKILRSKLEKTEQWLPAELSCLPKEKRIALTVKMEETIGNELLAVATKEKAIAELIKILSKDMGQPKPKPKYCFPDCNWWSFLKHQPPIRFCN